MSLISPVKVIVASSVPSPTEKRQPRQCRQRQRAVGRGQRHLHALPSGSTSLMLIRFPLPEEKTSAVSSLCLRGRHAVDRRVVDRVDGDVDRVGVGQRAARAGVALSSVLICTLAAPL
jgi:hypothetical protein